MAVERRERDPGASVAMLVLADAIGRVASLDVTNPAVNRAIQFSTSIIAALFMDQPEFMYEVCEKAGVAWGLKDMEMYRVLLGDLRRAYTLDDSWLEGDV